MGDTLTPCTYYIFYLKSPVPPVESHIFLIRTRYTYAYARAHPQQYPRFYGGYGGFGHNSLKQQTYFAPIGMGDLRGFVWGKPLIALINGSKYSCAHDSHNYRRNAFCLPHA